MADDTIRGGVWPNSASHVAMCRQVNFSIGLKIFACQCVEKCFSARLPSEGRSESLLTEKSRLKKMLAAGRSDGCCGFREAL